ncbi:tetratricopeptide repeat protein [Methanobrevibacter sp.]
MTNLEDVFNQSFKKKDMEDDPIKNPEDYRKITSHFNHNGENKGNLDNIDMDNTSTDSNKVLNINSTITDEQLINLQDDLMLKNKLSNIFNELNSEYDDAFELNNQKSQVLADVEMYLEAICYLNNALKIKEDMETQFKKAQYLHELNLNQDALNIVESILKNNPESFNTLKLKVMLLFSLNRFDDADIIFNKATSIIPEDITIYQEYADEYASIGNYDKALEINTNALDLFSNDLDLLYDRRYYLISNCAPSDVIDEINKEIQSKETIDLEDLSINSKIYQSLEEKDPELMGKVHNLSSDSESSTTKTFKSHPQTYESTDSDASDENDIYDLSSEDMHFDDEENIVDLDYENKIKKDKDDEKEFLDKKDKDDKSQKEVTLDNFF